MLTRLGKLALLATVAAILAGFLLIAIGCTVLPALDAAIGKVIPPPPTTPTGEPITDTTQYIFTGLVTLALGAIAIYVRNVKKNSCTKDEVRDVVNTTHRPA